MSYTDLKEPVNEEQEVIMNQSSATWRHSSIKYSIPRSHRFRCQTNMNQSMYDLRALCSERTCSMGKGEKSCIQPEYAKKMKEFPGPGYYDAIFTSRSRSHSFRRTGRFSCSNLQTPGPGAYQNRASSLAKNIKIKGRIQGIKPKPQPGPFEYIIHDPSAPMAHQITLKARFKPKCQEVTPGPGAYQPVKWPFLVFRKPKPKKFKLRLGEISQKHPSKFY